MEGGAARQGKSALRKTRSGTMTHVSANTILVLLAFSITNLVLPSCPAIRPIARDK